MFIPFMFYRYMNLNCTKALRKMKRHFILCFPSSFYAHLPEYTHIYTFYDTSSSSISFSFPLHFHSDIVKQMHFQMQQDFSPMFACTFEKRLFNIFMYEYAIPIHSHVFFDTFHLLFIEKMRTKKNLISELIKRIFFFSPSSSPYMLFYVA